MDLDRLTAEMAWVRRLAGAIVKDDALADDVAQDAWLVASKHAPDDRPLRPWLHRVVLNLARMGGRSASRRRARELSTEAQEVATPEQLAERVATQRAVADAVLALAEPYRDVVLLFYVECLPTRDIAKRLQIPDGTVRRRLKIARDDLKSKLVAAGLMAALVALVTSKDASAATAAVGALAMKKVIAVVVVVLMMLGGVAWWWGGRERGGDVTAATSSAGASGAGRASGGGGETSSQLPSWLAQAGAAPRRIAGHVVSGGAPVPTAVVRLGFDGQELVVVKVDDKTGAFDLGVQPAAIVDVSAEATGFAPASVTVMVADPKATPDALVLELGACAARLHGNVLDASGGGIAKARLSAAGLGGTEADEHGAYVLCMPRDAKVHVEADGYGAIEAPMQFSGDARHDFFLVPEGIVIGRVVDDGNRPVTGARVTATPDSSEAPHDVAARSAFADDSGAFRIAGLVPGRFQLTARADGLGATAAIRTLITTGKSSQDVTIVMTARGRVSGRVVHHGEPVPGVILLVNSARGESPLAASQSDGRFVLDDIPFGDIDIRSKTHTVRAPERLTVDRAKIDDVTVEVDITPAIRGHVTRHGRPVANAKVSCHSRPFEDVTTDPTGAYVMPAPTAAPEHPIRCDLDAGSSVDKAWSHDVLKQVTGDLAVDLELDEAGSVAGTVVDDQGAPVPAVYVNVTQGDDSGEATTDAQGRFECDMLRGGDYSVSVYPTPAMQLAFAPVGERPIVHVASGETAVTDVRVAIHHAAASIRGKVVDETGATVPDVQIEAIGSRGKTSGFAMPGTISDTNGAFSVDNLADGTYSLYAHAAGGGSEAMVPNIATGSTTTITLLRSGRVDGDLVGFTESVAVEARNANHPDLYRPTGGIVDGSHFTFDGLPPGTYTIEAGVRENGEIDGTSVDVKPGSTTHVTLTARKRTTLDGVVTDFVTHAPIASFQCWSALSNGGVQGVISALASQDLPTYPGPGQFAMGVPLGKVRIICQPTAGYAQTGVDTEVTVASHTHLVLAAVPNMSPPSDPGFALTPMMLPLTVGLVDSRGPATELAIGDHLVSIDGQSLAGQLPPGAITLASNHRVGTTMTLVVERAGVIRTVKVVARAF